MDRTDDITAELKAYQTKEGGYGFKDCPTKDVYKETVKQLDVGCGENRILVKKIQDLLDPRGRRKELQAAMKKTKYVLELKEEKVSRPQLELDKIRQGVSRKIVKKVKSEDLKK